jgi:O-antigen ligase
MNAGIASGAAIAILAWGVSALAASRPWGYVPLLAAMSLYGAASVLMHGPARIGRGLTFSFVLVCTAVFLQLIPLPGSWLSAISPALEEARQAGAPIGPTLSVDPNATALGLIFILVYGLFFLGLAKAMHRNGVQRIAVGVVALATIVAVVGIAEVNAYWGGVYAVADLPRPPDSSPLGPFSSKNHYAAWMLMSLGIALTYLCALLEQPNRMKIGHLIAIQGATTMMAVALVQTRSRAAILALTFALGVIGARMLHRAPPRAARRLVVSMAFMLVAAFATTGLQAIASRFATDSWSTAHGRLPILQQGAKIARDFSVAGSGFNTYQRIVRFYPSEAIDEPYEGAHNDFLQLAIEGGMLVGLPAMAMAGFFARDASRRLREHTGDDMTAWLRIGAVTGLVLVAALESVDFSLQIPANAALFIVLAAMAVHRTPHRNTHVTQRSSESEIKGACLIKKW